MNKKDMQIPFFIGHTS